jgi:colanic acid/amylovoran biosynthesis protein
MKIILIPGNTDLNRGDQALVWESIRLIEDACEDADITLMKGDDLRQYSQTEKLGYPLIHTVLKHPGRFFNKRKHVRYSVFDIAVMGLVAVFDFFLSSALLVRCRFVNYLAQRFFPKNSRETLAKFRNCDAVVVKGGGFIHSYGAITDAYQIYYLLFYMLLAIRYGKKLLILPNSIGPLKNGIARRLAIYVMNHADYVSVRESVSNDYLLSMKSLHSHIYHHADLGFFLNASAGFDAIDYLKNHGVDTSKQMVGITLRPYRFPGDANPEEKYRNYIDSVVALVQKLLEKRYQIILFSHTLGPGAHENDTLALEELSAILDERNLPYKFIEDVALDCRQVMSIYSHFTFLVGTRFHSVIFAQNSFVPTIAISYGGNKGVGIMKDAGLDDYSIPMGEISSERLVSAFERLETDRNEVIEQLRQHRNELENDRDIMVNEVKKVLTGGVS